MNLTSPKQVKELLEKLGVRPSKSLGQNFLIDRNVLEILVAASDAGSGDSVLEIGPGLGVLTDELAARAGRVVAVEKDARLAAHLRERFQGNACVSIIQGDVLDVDMEGLIASGANKLVSNLPYSSGGRVLAAIAMGRNHPGTIVVTVQREVGERMTAVPGCGDYGLLSLWLQTFYDVGLVKNVSGTCFWPVPDVTSVIVRMTAHGRITLAEDERLSLIDITKYAFSHRRKKMATILNAYSGRGARSAGQVPSILRRAGVDAASRPENITPQAWVELLRVFMHMADGPEAGNEETVYDTK